MCKKEFNFNRIINYYFCLHFVKCNSFWLLNLFVQVVFEINEIGSHFCNIRKNSEKVTDYQLLSLTDDDNNDKQNNNTTTC